MSSSRNFETFRFRRLTASGVLLKMEVGIRKRAWQKA